MDNQELYDWILDNLDYRLEKVERKGVTKWCYPIGDSSGRDFYKYIPLEHLEDDRIDSLAEEVFDDFEYEYDDADWEEFHEIFEEVFYTLVDENLGK